MRVASGEDDDFACFDRNRLPADDTSEAPTFRDHMISDHVLGTRKDLRQDHLRPWLLGNPWCLGHDVKERGTSQPYRSQHIR